MHRCRYRIALKGILDRPERRADRIVFAIEHIIRKRAPASRPVQLFDNRIRHRRAKYRIFIHHAQPIRTTRFRPVHRTAGDHTVSFLELRQFLDYQAIIISFIRLVTKPDIQPHGRIFISAITKASKTDRIDRQHLHRIRDNCLSPYRIETTRLCFQPQTIAGPHSASGQYIASRKPAIGNGLHTSLRTVVYKHLYVAVPHPVVRDRVQDKPAFGQKSRHIRIRRDGSVQHQAWRNGRQDQHHVAGTGGRQKQAQGKKHLFHRHQNLYV